MKVRYYVKILKPNSLTQVKFIRITKRTAGKVLYRGSHYSITTQQWLRKKKIYLGIYINKTRGCFTIDELKDIRKR